MRRATANRILLGLVGLLLLALGLAVLIGSSDLQTHWDFRLPPAWPFSGPKDVLLTNHDRTLYTSDDWWWPVGIAFLSVMLLASLIWLLAQLRTGRLRQLRIDTEDEQGALIRGQALERVLTDEAEAYDGVEWAGATILERDGAPRARLVLGLAPHATPRDVVAGLDDEVLANARTSAALRELPAEVRLRAVRHRARRVS
ncbi:alkaline shock response membrane anchor protein AmaP [Streptomyces sp. NBC_01190]|uniref:alkaline shock response membrane anchor protein AmaP n=1 Tax=Streptomyces sp. NBC_01190 TaxID=2903767 RepID=UPI00386A7336|nr:alkaline shock response membrane anchor protein AmaP [Streptomyces sp. NBC_01190]